MQRRTVVGISVGVALLFLTGAVLLRLYPRTNSMASSDSSRPLSDVSRDTDVPDTMPSVAETELEQIRQHATDDGLGDSLGHRVAMGRTKRLIDTLTHESLTDSLDRLDHVDDFFYPGYDSASYIRKPFDDIHLLLSNRRVVKVADEIAKLRPDEQSTLVARYTKRYLEQYRTLFENHSRENYWSLPNGKIDAFRITDVEGLPKTLTGTRQALRAVLLAGAMAGNCRTWEELRPVLGESVAGYAVDRSKFDGDLLQKLEYQPLISKGIIAQIIYQLYERADERELARVGLKKDVIGRAISPSMVQVLPVPDFRGRISNYDILRKAGAVLDTSQGVTEHSFLTSSEVDAILVAAAVRLGNR
jgi:hypothetical protein